MDNIRPVLNEPALVLEGSAGGRYLVIADLHLGIEHSLTEKGVQIPSSIQTKRVLKRLLKIIKRVQPTGLIILGDVKHNVPSISQQEWQVIPPFFEKLKTLSVYIIPGNHDALEQIEGLTPRNVSLQPAHGCLIEIQGHDKTMKVGLFHGHTWPGEALFQADVIIMAHNHPVIEFRNQFNVKMIEPVWIYTHWDKGKLARAYLKHKNIKKPKNPIRILEDKFQISINEQTQVIIMPGFNDLLGGIPFNAKDPTFIGPLLKSKSLNLEMAEAILLDGTILGKLKEIRMDKLTS